MARSFVTSTKSGSAAFVTAINAALAALTNPTIRGISFNADERQRRNGRSYSGVISYDTGGAALATPFLLSVIEASSMAALVTALNAFVAANPTSFIAHTEYKYLYTGSRDPRFIALTLYNATAGATANYVPY
jgi:hypothetical protein